MDQNSETKKKNAKEKSLEFQQKNIINVPEDVACRRRLLAPAIFANRLVGTRTAWCH